MPKDASQHEGKRKAQGPNANNSTEQEEARLKVSVVSNADMKLLLRL